MDPTSTTRLNSFRLLAAPLFAALLFLTAGVAGAQPWTLTVESVNPATGVVIGVSPLDNSSAGEGTTSFTRTYNDLANVTLTAPPDDGTGNTFVRWDVGISSFTTNEITVSMDAAKTATAVYGYTLTTASNPVAGGSVTKTPDQTAYESGTSVSIQADAVAGYRFDTWSGAVTTTTNPESVTMTQDASVTANFVEVFDLSVDALNNSSPVTIGVSPADNGAQTGGTTLFTRTYDTGTTVTLSAPANEPGGDPFVQWRVDGSVVPDVAGEIDVTMSAARTAVAVYGYTLDVTTVGNGSVAATPNETVFDFNDVVSLDPAADPGWTFDGWSGDATGNDDPLSVTMNADKSITATFSAVATTFDLTVASENPASGVVIGVSPLDNSSAGEGTTPFMRTYNEGELVTLTAPLTAGGNNFLRWEVGSVTEPDTNGEITVTMNAVKTATAIYGWTLTTTINPALAGTITPDVAGPDYADATDVQLTAAANSGYRFENFSGALTGSVNPQTVTMDADKSVTANFVEVFDLSVDALNNSSPVTIGVSPADNGAQTGGTTLFTRTYDTGTTVTLSAPANEPGGDPFVQWRVDGSVVPDVAGEIDVTMSAARTAVAVYGYTLDVTTVGNGSVAATPNETVFDFNDVVSLDPAADPGWTFAGWSGDATGNNDPLSVTMNADKAITATFIQEWILTIASTDPNSGVGINVTPADNDFLDNGFTQFTRTYDDGTTVTLTAPADASSGTRAFVRWEVDSTPVADINRSINVTMDAAKTATAVYGYTLTTNTVGNGSISRNPDQTTFAPGESVDLTATPDAGWQFTGWSGAASGTANPVTVTMDADKSVTATFSEIVVPTYTLTVGSDNPVSGVLVAVSPQDINSQTGGETEFQRVYQENTDVTLTAPLNGPGGNEFIEWRVDGSPVADVDRAITVTMNANRSATAFYRTLYTLSTPINGNGTVTRNPNETNYDPGTNVDLTASADPGWRFSGWSGDATGTTNPLTVTMNADKAITATFIEQCTLTVGTSGPGSVDVTNTTVDCGTDVDVTATPDAGASFTGWSGDASGTANPLTVTVNTDKNITATFSTTPTSVLTVASVNPASGVLIAVNPADNAAAAGGNTEFTRVYDDGTDVTLQAPDNAANGNEFVEWQLAGAPQVGNPIVVTMNSDVTATAIYKTVYTLDVTTVGSGTVARNPAQASYDPGTNVDLTATPTAGWRFAGWSDDATGSTNPLTVNMNSDKSITATFVEQCTLTVGVNGAGSVDVTNTTVDCGTVVPVTATPNEGAEFTGWTGAASGTTNPLNVTVDTDKNITANFGVIPTYTLTVASANPVSGIDIAVSPADNASQANGTTQFTRIYNEGASVTLTAPAEAPNGHAFDEWQVDGSPVADVNGEITVAMTAARTATAVYSTRYLLTTPIVGEGSVSRSPNATYYDPGTMVQLTAAPDPGWRFEGWTGDVTSSSNPINVTMSAARSITATFVQERTLTVSSTNPNTGVSILVSPIDNDGLSGAQTQFTRTYDDGTMVSLTAPQTASNGNALAGWLVDGVQVAGNPIDVEMTADRTATVVYDTRYTLDTSTSGSGSIERNPDASSYAENAEVQLSATPDPGWRFGGWTGDVSSSANPLNVVMDGDKSVTANFIERCTLSVNASGPGSVSTNLEVVDCGTQIQVTASPDALAEFNGWSGDAFGTQNPLTVPVDDDKSITASFSFILADTYDLTIRSENPNSGVQVDVNPADNDGAADGSTQFVRNYDEETVIELTAPDPAPNGNAFVEWQVTGSSASDISVDGNTLSIQIEEDLTATAVYQTAFLLETNVLGEGSITRNPDQASYAPNADVELTAVPVDGWQFDGWSGDASGTQNPLTVTMDEAKSITATFSMITRTLTVASAGDPSGVTVFVSPADLNGDSDATTDFDRVYNDGATVTLTAPASAGNGNQFGGWLIDGTPAEGNPIDVDMTGDITATAVYSQVYELNLSADGQGSVSADPDLGTYPAGANVELTATPNSGWQFDGWTGDATGSQNPLTVEMDSDKSITALFSMIPADTFILTVQSGNPASGVAVAVSPADNSGLSNGTTQFTRMYTDGASVSLTAPSEAPNGNAFLRWEVDGSPVAGNPIGVAMNQNRSVQAVYETRYELSTPINGEGSVSRAPNRNLFAPDEEVVLTASPAAGWRFGTWSGDASGSQNPLTVTMDADKSITATFVERCSLTVTVVGPGEVDVMAATRDCGGEVQITATPDENAVFNGWSGDASGDENPLTVLLDTNKEITASFSEIGADTWSLTVGSQNPASGVDIQVAPADNDGASDGLTQFQRLYDDGATVSLTAPVQAPDGNLFVEWQIDGSPVAGNPINVQMTQDRSAVAVFGDSYALETTIVGQGTVARDPDQSAYSPDSQVDLTAMPASGWRFDAWSGDASGSQNPLSVTMDSDKSITATFIEQCTLTATATGPGSVSPTSQTVDCGDDVVVTATPNSGARFNGWSGDASGTQNPITVTVDGDLAITAAFSTAGATTFELTVASLSPESGVTVFVSPTDNNGATGGTTRFTRNYDDGTTVMLTATSTAPNGNAFREWQVDGSSVSGNPINVQMTADRTVTAIYVSRFQLTTSVQSGQGTVTRDPNQALFPANSEVTLTATPSTGWTFSGWSGDAVGSDNPLVVTMDSDKSISATFIEDIQAPPTYEIEQRRTFNDAEESDSYRLIGLPGENGPTFASTFSGQPGEDWNAFWDNGSESANSEDYLVPYSSSSSTFTFRPGRGFWAISSSPWNVSGTQVDQVDLSGNNTFAVRLHPGWNIISSPFDIDVPWSAVTAASGVAGDIYSYDGTWDVADELRRYEGFYYYNRTGAVLDLMIPYTGNAGKTSAASKSGSGNSSVSTLTFTDADGRIAHVELGIHDRALVGVDDLDRFAPPGAFSSLDVALENPWSESGLPKLRRDVRPASTDGYAYDIRVQAEGEVSAVFTDDGSGRAAVLVDPQSGITVDLTNGAPRTVPAGRFVLVTGSKAFVSDQVGEQIEQPLVVQTAYPNPSSGRFTVDYALKEPGSVQIAVVDMLGREVIRRDLGRHERGLHEASLDLDSGGRSLASGIYFVIVRGDAASRSQRVVVVR